MQESDRREIVLSGAEAALLDEAFEHHEPKASDVDAETINELESEFETDLEATADGRFEITRAAARLVVSSIEEYEPLVDGQTEARLDELREQFVNEFELEEQSSTETEPVEEEEYPGSS